MLKQDEQQSLTNRDHRKHELVTATHKKNKETGIFETVQDIFSRLPLPRIQKSNYKFLFEGIKEDVEKALDKEDQLIDIQQEEEEKVLKIQPKFGKIPPFPPDQDLNNQTLQSGRPIFNCLVYLQEQKVLNSAMREGQHEPFLQKTKYINFNETNSDIPSIKLFAKAYDPLTMLKTQFINENTLIFKNKAFPSSQDIQNRAQILAKIYLLHMYRDESRKMLMIDRNEEAELEKKRQINKIKQEMDIEKMKEGELIEDMDLLKQVYKIRDLIQKKMNALAYEQFKARNGPRATAIKKSLEKLKSSIDAEPSAKIKLKMLINYKYQKGW